MSNVSKSIDNEFRWETLLTRIKKSCLLVERIGNHANPMLNFKFEKILVDFMKTLTDEEQTLLDFESLVVADILPSDTLDAKEFTRLKHEL